MKQSQAIKHVRTLMYTVQRIRSILDETGIITSRDIDGLHLTEEMASHQWKWIWGKNCILPVIIKVLDDCEDSGTLAPHDFYNLLTVATQLESMIGAAARMYDMTFPIEPSILWLKGWDSEKDE